MVSRTEFGIAGASAVAAFVRFPASAAEFTYKLSTNIQRERATALRVAQALSDIARDSGGRLQIEFFPGSSLGSGADTLAQTRLGAIELILVADADLSTVVPVAGMTTVPFVVSSRKQALDIVAGPFGEYLRNAAAKVGMYQFPGGWDIGFNQIENGVRPIRVPSDLRGLRIRSTLAKQEIDVLKAFGVTPVPLSAAEIYTGLQTHVVDGATLPISVLEAYRVFEVTKYFSYTNHSWACFSLCANADAWRRLPKDVQGVVSSNFESARKLSNVDQQHLDDVSEQRLRTHGMVFNNVDTPAFRKAVIDAGLYSQWKASFPPDAWALLERSLGHQLS